jgi:hypothetical protein
MKFAAVGDSPGHNDAASPVPSGRSAAATIQANGTAQSSAPAEAANKASLPESRRMGQLS